MKKEYSNGELTIVWRPEKCIHAGVCVKTLPQVYQPKEKPWVKIENANTEELKAQVSQCPSGALSYYYNKDGPQKSTAEATNATIEVTANGPLLIHGNIILKNSTGKETEEKQITALCRCGASANKPYCDGAHKRIDFKG